MNVSLGDTIFSCTVENQKDVWRLLCATHVREGCLSDCLKTQHSTPVIDIFSKILKNSIINLIIFVLEVLR